MFRAEKRLSGAKQQKVLQSVKHIDRRAHLIKKLACGELQRRRAALVCRVVYTCVVDEILNVVGIPADRRKKSDAEVCQFGM